MLHGPPIYHQKCDVNKKHEETLANGTVWSRLANQREETFYNKKNCEVETSPASAQSTPSFTFPHAKVRIFFSLNLVTFLTYVICKS